jgi:hypothetical protein
MPLVFGEEKKKSKSLRSQACRVWDEGLGQRAGGSEAVVVVGLPGAATS